MERVGVMLSAEVTDLLAIAVEQGDADQYYQILIGSGVEYGYLALGAASNGGSGNWWADFGGIFANNFLEGRFEAINGHI